MCCYVKCFRFGILFWSCPDLHVFWKLGLWETEQMPGESEPSFSNRRSTRGDSRVIRSRHDVHRICRRQRWWKPLSHRSMLVFSFHVSEVYVTSGWRLHLEGESDGMWSSDGRLVDRESLPDPARDIVFSVSVTRDRTTQVGKSFSFVNELLANEYWDIWSRVANVHDLHLGRSNSAPFIQPLSSLLR